MFRVEPQAGPEAYKSYVIAAPLSTHWRPATCEEAGCEAFLNGWRTVVPADSPQAAYIRGDRSRSCRMEIRDGMAEFTFGPGQTCFAQHRARLDRPERFLITGGDHRGNPRGTPPVELRPDQWQEDMAGHLDRLKSEIERG